MAHKRKRIRRHNEYIHYSNKEYLKHKPIRYAKYIHHKKNLINNIAFKKKKNKQKRTSSTRNFESTVSRILDHIFSVKCNPSYKENFEIKRSKEETDTFMKANAYSSIKKIHKGFKEAQIIIIDNLILIQSRLKEENEKLKSERRNKGENQNLIKNSISLLKYEEAVFKHLADTIFWQLIQGKIHIARRFFQNVPGDKTLQETNYESVLAVANKINSNPINFVLLTDITNYVQLGDLIGLVSLKNRIIEVKEGKKNEEILGDIENAHKNNFQIEDLFDKYQERPKDFKQLQRILKQKKINDDELKIMNEDKGFDHSLGHDIEILTPKEKTPYYDKELIDLEKQLETRNFWAYTIIDSCLHIGLYKGEYRSKGKFVLESIAAEEKIEHKLIYDARGCMSLPCTPLFFLPFSKQLIMDIVLGKVFMFLMLDIDKFLLLHEIFGITYTWASSKETTKAREKLNGQYMYVADNKAIQLKNADGVEGFVTYGSLTKIIYDHINPSYVAYSFSYMKST